MSTAPLSETDAVRPAVLAFLCRLKSAVSCEVFDEGTISRAEGDQLQALVGQFGEWLIATDWHALFAPHWG